MTPRLNQIFAKQNRGILLDLIAFLVNLFLMIILTRQFVALVDQAEDDLAAKAVMAVFCFGVCFLQPIGATLKHRRAHIRYLDENRLTDFPLFLVAGASGFVLLFQFVFITAGTSFALHAAGKTNLYFSLCLGQVVLAFINYRLVRAYLRPPAAKEPRLKFLSSPQAEMLGDAFLFLNMILSQVFWGYLLVNLMQHQTFIGEFGLLQDFLRPKYGFKYQEFLMAFLIFYLPPRFIYLLEDRHRKITWLTMLLPNSPLIYRLFFA